jgi:atypical dual specificity phosphatase
LLPLASPAAALFVVSILGAAYLGQSKETKKWLFCEFSMMNNQIVSRIPAITRRPWQSPITDLISLSACPLLEQVEKLKAERYDAVLSLVEPFEVESHLFGIPAKPEDWRKAGIEFLNLPNPDMTPVRDEDVERGVEFLHRNISLGRRVLVHCQAGVGRSATIVICYLIKHGGMSPRHAAAFVQAKRSIAVNEHSLAIKNFVEKVNQQVTSSSRVA